MSYSVEDPTSYPGRSYIALEFGSANSPFREVLVHGPEGGSSLTLAGAAESRVADVGAGGSRLAAAELPATRAMMRDDDDMGPGPRPIEDFDPPEATLVVVSPQEGATFTTTAGSLELAVEVEVSYWNPTGSTIPGSVRLVVNGAETSASQVSGSGLVRRYRAAVGVPPGPVSLSATVRFGGLNFAVVAPRNVLVQKLEPPKPDSPVDSVPPTVTMDWPAPGSVVMLPSAPGAARVTVGGTATDDRGPVSSVRLRAGAAEVDVSVVSGKWSHVVELGSVGSHLLTVSAKDAAGNASAQVARTVEVTPKAQVQRFRLLIVECLRLTNFLGDYGAGRVVQTFSLLPGEKTDITIRSFNTESSTSTETSSIFDSYSSTTGDELTTAVADEATTTSSQEEALKASVNVKAGATWAFGSASVEAGLAYNTASAREQATKNVTNAASRHAAEISSKRDVKVDTTKVVTTTSESEQTIVRHLENTNLSRTLNFVFRQMTQEFISIVHLVDVRVALVTEYFEADSGERVWRTVEGGAEPELKIDYEEASLPELPSLLRRVCKSPEQVERVQRTVYRQLDAVFDAQGNQVEILSRASRSVPERDPVTFAKTGKVNEISWVRFDPHLRQSWPPEPSGEGERGEKAESAKARTVPGVILGVTTNTLRTDGVVVDAFLGGGVALDTYARQLQTAAASERRAQAWLTHAKRDQLVLANTIVEGGDKARAETYALMFPSANGASEHP